MKKIYTLVGIALISGAAIAQAPYAVNGQYQFGMAGAKHAPNGITFYNTHNATNQDRIDYYEEDFDGGLNGWVAATQTGNVDWQLTSTGHANDAGSSFFIPAMLSSTPTQWMLIDSDSDGSSGQAEAATLTSPVIDLTVGGTVTVPSALKLEFEQFFAEWEQGGSYDTLHVGISDDGGANWDEIIICDGVGREGRPNPELVSLNISPYVVDPTQVQIRFRWEAVWAYGWQVDNVFISELPDNDMKIVNVFRGDLVNSFMYSQVPQDQVTEFVIGADVQNIGFLDQTNVAIDWEIFNPSAVSMGSGTSTATIANLANGENDTIWISTGITPAALGNYSIEFTVTATNVDDVPANNDMTDDYFWVTDYTYAADYGAAQTAFYNWSGNNDGSCSIGNIYVINQDGVIGGMDAELDDQAGVEGQIIYYMIYKWDGAEYAYEAQTDDYTVTPADNGEIVRLYFDPIDVVQGDAVIALAAHYGGVSPASAGYEMAGRVAQGAVAGTDDASALVSLIDPSAPVARLLMIDFTETEEVAQLEKFEVYPNPANEVVNIKLNLVESDNTVINVRDITGKVIKTINVGTVNGDKNLAISLDEMTTGIYFVELVNADGKQVKKFVKK